MSHFDGLLPFADAFTVLGVITFLSAFFAGLFWLLNRLDALSQLRPQEQPQEPEPEEISEAILTLKDKWQAMPMEQH